MTELAKKILTGLLYVAAFLLLLLPSIVQAQTPTLTFTAQTMTGAGSVIPEFTWSTSPAAASCTASGDPEWTGPKLSNGTATLAAIMVSKTYLLACNWPQETFAKLTWTPPTLNTDGSPYTNPKGFRIQFGTPPTNLNQTKSINVPTATTDTLTGLATGTWGFCVRAVSSVDIESDCTATVTKAITDAPTVTRSISITVNPKPAMPTNVVVE